jgi:hypothetical protein
MKAGAHKQFEGPEDDLQILVVDFLEWALPPEVLYFHVPNGGARPQVTKIDRHGKKTTFCPEGKKLKRMGVRPGVLDIPFIFPTGQIAFIELKVKNGSLSDDQVDFIEDCRQRKVATAVCYSLEDVVDVLNRWLPKFGLKLRLHGALFAGA